jgi:outer membrane lipoprotein-sorting protein
MSRAGWLLFLSVTITAASLASAPPSDAVKKLLEKVVQRYQNAKTLILSGVMVNTSKSPQRETSVTTRFTLYAQRPNRLRLVTETTLPEGIKQRQVIVSDGKFLFTEFPQLKQVLRQPLTPEGKIPRQMPFGGIFEVEDWLKRVKEAQIAGEEKVRGRTMKIVKVATDEGASARLWIADNALWQVQAVIEGKRLSALMGSDPKKPNPLAEAMKQTTLIMTMKFDRVQFNAPIPANLFSYKPPEGFKVVEKLELPSSPTMPPSPSPKP